MIALAEAQKQRQPLGVSYSVGDAPLIFRLSGHTQLSVPAARLVRHENARCAVPSTG